MKERVSILDGFRVLAILVVMLHHYCYKDNLSGDFLNTLLYYGSLGVAFFFMISGFVISITLESTKTLKEFFVKRYIRLAPAMLLCSTITFLLFKFVFSQTIAHNHNSSQFPNYLIANTFIDPAVYNLIEGKSSAYFYYIDGSYWSLWVEVCFYFIIGILFFLNKDNYVRNFFIFSTIGFVLYYLFLSNKGGELMVRYFNFDKEFIDYAYTNRKVFAFFHDCYWFLIGMLFYRLFKDKNAKINLLYIALLSIPLLIVESDFILIYAYAIMLMLFLTFIYFPKYLSYMSLPLISKIGVASYAIYLIHSYVGNAIIKLSHQYFGLNQWILSIIVIVIMCVFGILSYKYYELPVSKYLRKKLL